LSDQLQTENQVIESLKVALIKRGWKIVASATTMEHGVDLHATQSGGKVLYVEAKGNTSSKEGSNRHGLIQTGSQHFIQVAAALLKCAELKSAEPKAYVAIAVPLHSRMQGRVERIEPVLKAADIAVLWVAGDGAVTAWNAPWFGK
jgi:hypothetical protein